MSCIYINWSQCCISSINSTWNIFFFAYLKLYFENISKTMLELNARVVGKPWQFLQCQQSVNKLFGQDVNLFKFWTPMRVAEEAETLCSFFFSRYLLGICIWEATVKLHILDAARRDHIHVQVEMVWNPLWQLFFYFYFLIIWSVQDTTKNERKLMILSYIACLWQMDLCVYI